MVSGIGSVGMRPNPQDFFKKIDSDSNGGVSQTELKTMADKMSEKTGNVLDVSDDAFKGYDSDSDGSLSTEELNAMMENSGFGPPMGMAGMQPPAAPPQQGVDAYGSAGSTGSSQDELSAIIDSLKALLEKLSSGSDSDGSSSGAASQSGEKHGAGGLFKDTDSDSSGGISQDEMKVLAENLKSATGQSLDVSDEAFQGYDSDGDGALSADELKSAMESNGFQPPQGPPPDRMRAESDSSSTDDQLSELKKLIESLSKYASSGSSDSTSVLSVTT